MSTNVPTDTKAKTAKQLRKMRLRRLAIRMGVGIGLPMVIAGIYYGLIASPRYESVTSFTIQSALSGVIVMCGSLPRGKYTASNGVRVRRSGSFERSWKRSRWPLGNPSMWTISRASALDSRSPTTEP